MLYSKHCEKLAENEIIFSISVFLYIILFLFKYSLTDNYGLVQQNILVFTVIEITEICIYMNAG